MSARRTGSRRIPGLAPGILFFAVFAFLSGAFAAAAGSPTALAEALVEEEDWAAARIEARRAEAASNADAADAARARLIQGIAALRAGDVTGAENLLPPLWQLEDAPADLETSCLAAYEWGRSLWARRQFAPAAEALAYAFRHTRDPELFWLAGCSLHFLLDEAADVAATIPGRAGQVEFAAPAWPDRVWRRCNPRTSGMREAARNGVPALFSLPGRAIVRFYRAQVSPAIGSRCSLTPSCSEYFLQASRKHGLLGVPLIGDRFIREPDVVNAHEPLVEQPDGAMRIADPVEAHDFWMEPAP